METLLKIIEEKMLLIEQLQAQLAEQTERAEENSKTMIYWYDKCNTVLTPKTEKNGSN